MVENTVLQHYFNRKDCEEEDLKITRHAGCMTRSVDELISLISNLHIEEEALLWEL